MRLLLFLAVLLFGCTVAYGQQKPHSVYYLPDYSDSLPQQTPTLSLAVVLHLDSDSLAAPYLKYFPVWEKRYIYITVSRSAKCKNVNAYDANDSLKHLLEKKFRRLNYPYLVAGSKQDTIAYELVFTLRHSRATQRAALTLLLEKNTTHQIKSFIHNDLDGYFLSGDLFHTGEMLAVGGLRADPEYFLFKKENAQWHVLDSIFVLNADPTFNEQLRLEDLDLDGTPEFIMGSGPNMNGNCWYTILRYDTARHQLRYAGSFNTSYEIDTLRNEIHVEYAGSWYMPYSKTIYRWHNGVLLPWKKLESAFPDETTADYNDDRYVTLYENPEWKNGKDTLVAVRTEKERHSAKQQQEWDDFFK